MALKLKEYRSSFDRGPALADYLPYDSHDDGVFILKDGSLGMMWSLATITEEGMSDEERDRVRVAIEGVVMRIPAELACQIILISSSRIEPVLQNFLSIGNFADPMTRLFLDSRMEIIRDAAKNGFPGSGGEFRPRILSIYFTVRYFLGWRKPGLADSLRSVLLRPGLLRNSYETSYKRGREKFGRLARFIAQALRLDPMIFIIDKGGSYERICELFGGQYFTVDLDHLVAVKSFAGELTREKRALLTTLIVAMATRNDEREHVDAENVGVIEEALVKLYQRVKDREIQLSDLTEVLVKDYGKRGKGLRQRLFAFTREGQFGMFFDRPNELKAHSTFNIFDLKRLDGYPELQASFLLVTMNFIISSIQSTDPGRPKYLFIDEAWALLKNEASARYVAEAFRTYRKLGCAVVAISQAVSDFLAVPGGKTILQNAATKILLRQERKTVSTLKEELKLSPEEVQLVSSVATVPGVRSEFYLRTSWGSGVGILYLSSIMYWVTTTDFRDIERYRRKLAEFGGNQIETIKALAREDIRRKAI